MHFKTNSNQSICSHFNFLCVGLFVGFHSDPTATHFIRTVNLFLNHIHHIGTLEKISKHDRNYNSMRFSLSCAQNHFALLIVKNSAIKEDFISSSTYLKISTVSHHEMQAWTIDNLMNCFDSLINSRLS